MTIPQDIEQIARGIAVYAHPDTRDMVEKSAAVALSTYGAAREAKGREEERERIINICVSRTEEWRDKGFEVDTLIDALKVIELEERL